MTQKNFSFWFCTLLSGVVIGIASQRIPEAYSNSKAFKPHSYSCYCSQQHALAHQPVSSFQIQRSGCTFACDRRYSNSKWVYETTP